MAEKKTKKHTNDEPTVICPVDGCEKEVLSRGLHLHIRKSDGGGHGERDTVPEDVSLDDATPVGEESVTMTYHEKREGETVARLCPYCERPFMGKHGVMIHLGQTEGRKDHPEDATDRHDPSELAIVRVDEDGNIVETVQEQSLPSADKRRKGGGVGALQKDRVEDYIEGLRDQGLDKEAERAEAMLLGE